MATITVHREHFSGLQYLIRSEFEEACQAQDANRLRAILPVDEEIRHHEPGELHLPDGLLDMFIRDAWEIGNERMAAVYSHRASGEALGYLDDPGGYEREARSLLAFHEHMQGQRVAS